MMIKNMFVYYDKTSIILYSGVVKGLFESLFGYTKGDKMVWV